MALLGDGAAPLSLCCQVPLAPSPRAASSHGPSPPASHAQPARHALPSAPSLVAAAASAGVLAAATRASRASRVASAARAARAAPGARSVRSAGNRQQRGSAVRHASAAQVASDTAAPDRWEDCDGFLRRSSLLRGCSFFGAAFGLSSEAEAVAAGATLTSNALRDLRGRSAVVTGASRGIGKGIAVGLGEAGATVFVTGRDAAGVAATAALVTRAGGRGIPLPCDHSDDAQVAAAFAEVSKQTGGKLDILVNNAFKDPSSSPAIEEVFSRGGKFYELPLSVWDDIHTVGLRSHYVSSYYAAPLLLAAAQAEAATPTPWRPLIATTSSFGAVSYLFATAYGVGKTGSDRLMRDLHVELSPQGVDCLSVWPGLVLTEKIQELLRKDPARISRITGGQDASRVAESPLLSGRIVARLAAEPVLRQTAGGIMTPEGITGRVCIVAEAAKDLGVLDGGKPGSLAAELYGAERKPAPSIRSLGFLGPGPLRNALPDGLKWIADPGGLLANDNLRLPLEFMAQGPPPAPPSS